MLKSIGKSLPFCIRLTAMLISCRTVCYSQQEKMSNPCPMNADIWVLAGQSNMDGNGRTPDTSTNSKIMMLGLDNRWVRAQNPLHRIYEAAAPAYELTIREFPWYREMDKDKVREELTKKSEESKKHPIGGVGPGIYFARRIFDQTDRPIALIPCGIGGTTMDQWNPTRKPGGDSILYGAMINRIKSVGGDIKGFIWYQGESEAMSGNTKHYENELLGLIDSFRKDIRNPDLPIIIVQIGRFVIKNSAMDRTFEEVREIQRTVTKKRQDVYMVTSIDLPLDDAAHLSSDGQRRLGKRIAEVALTYIYGLKDHGKQIDLETMKMCKDDKSGSNYLHLHFSGVSGRLTCCGLPSQFELRVNGEPRYEYVVSKTELDLADAAGLNLFLSAISNDPTQLICGSGTNPYVNITDSLDIAIPAFGPVDIQSK